MAVPFESIDNFILQFDIHGTYRLQYLSTKMVIKTMDPLIAIVYKIICFSFQFYQHVNDTTVRQRILRRYAKKTW